MSEKFARTELEAFVTAIDKWADATGDLSDAMLAFAEADSALGDEDRLYVVGYGVSVQLNAVVALMKRLRWTACQTLQERKDEAA